MSTSVLSSTATSNMNTNHTETTPYDTRILYDSRRERELYNWRNNEQMRPTPTKPYNIGSDISELAPKTPSPNSPKLPHTNNGTDMTSTSAVIVPKPINAATQGLQSILEQYLNGVPPDEIQGPLNTLQWPLEKKEAQLVFKGQIKRKNKRHEQGDELMMKFRFK